MHVFHSFLLLVVVVLVLLLFLKKKLTGYTLPANLRYKIKLRDVENMCTKQAVMLHSNCANETKESLFSVSVLHTLIHSVHI